MSELREGSRLNYEGESSPGNLTHEEIAVGALQCIADAVELMAKSHHGLADDAEVFRSDRDLWKRIAESRGRKILALEGVITKMKESEVKDG